MTVVLVTIDKDGKVFLSMDRIKIPAKKEAIASQR